MYMYTCDNPREISGSSSASLENEPYCSTSQCDLRSWPVTLRQTSAPRHHNLEALYIIQIHVYARCLCSGMQLLYMCCSQVVWLLHVLPHLCWAVQDVAPVEALCHCLFQWGWDQGGRVWGNWYRELRGQKRRTRNMGSIQWGAHNTFLAQYRQQTNKKSTMHWQYLQCNVVLFLVNGEQIFIEAVVLE